MNAKFPYRYRVLILLFFLIFICILDRVAFSLVSVRIMSAFHLTNEQFGWTVSAFGLAYAFFEIPSGVLGDRIGQRSLLIRIVLWWSLFTALTGFTTGLVSLLLVRFLFGAGEAGAFPNAVGALSRWMPAKEISRGYSSIAIGIALGQTVAPFIIVPIAAGFGWRVPFFVISLFGLVWAIVCFSWFRNNPSEKKNISNEELNYIETNRKIENHSHRFSWKTAFKNRNLWVLPIAYFASNFGWSLYVFWLPAFVQKGLGFSENSMKNITALTYLMGAIGAFTMGYGSDLLVRKRGLKFGRRFIGVTSLGFAAILFFSMGVTSNITVKLICLFASNFLVVSGSIAFFSTCIDIGGNNVGAVTGVMNTAGQSAVIINGIVIGKLAHAHIYNSSIFVVAAVWLVGALMWLLVDPTKKIAIEDKKLIHVELVAPA
ncbi:MAG: MFS transporter [Bacteroidetes bacterium]|nr:MAG: MFS transporter [Bacteroidota bacterium]